MLRQKNVAYSATIMLLIALFMTGSIGHETPKNERLQSSQIDEPEFIARVCVDQIALSRRAKKRQDKAKEKQKRSDRKHSPSDVWQESPPTPLRRRATGGGWVIAMYSDENDSTEYFEAYERDDCGTKVESVVRRLLTNVPGVSLRRHPQHGTGPYYARGIVNSGRWDFKITVSDWSNGEIRTRDLRDSACESPLGQSNAILVKVTRLRPDDDHCTRRGPNAAIIIAILLLLALSAAELPWMAGLIGLAGAMAAQGPEEDPRDELRRAMERLGFERGAEAMSAIPPSEARRLLEALNQRSSVNHDAVNDMDDEEIALLESEISDEVTRMHGRMVEGCECPVLKSKERHIHSFIERSGLRAELMRFAGCPIESDAVERLNDAVRVVAKLTKDTEEGLTWCDVYNSVMAVGDPQMGKTKTFLLVAIIISELGLEIGIGMRIIVIVSGRPKEPRTQTLIDAENLATWRSGRARFTIASEQCNDLGRNNTPHFQRRVAQAIERDRIPILVVKKDTHVLTATETLVENLGVKGLLIQDEADEAAVQQRQSGRLVQEEVGIHGLVTRIRSALGGPYVGFTATENAILLMKNSSPLFPRRLVMLTPGQKYRGPAFWLLQRPDCMSRPVSESDEAFPRRLDKRTVRTWRNRPPESVGRFLCDHVVATATKRLKGQDAISKALANISQRVDVQEAFGEVLKRLQVRLSRCLEGYLSTGEWQDSKIEEWFRDSVEQQIERLEFWGLDIDDLEGVTEQERIRKIAENSLPVLNHLSPYLLNEDTKDTWDEDVDNVIVVAGNKAGRAVVFKGLTIQFMPLDPINFVEDTNLQRLRCCGYRSITADLPFMSLCLKESVEQNFVKLVRMRLLKRGEMRIIDRANLDVMFTEIPFEVPTATSPTGPSRIGEGQSTRTAHTSTTRLVRDRTPVTFRDGAVSIPEDETKWRRVSNILSLLRLNCENVGLAEPAGLMRGVVFKTVDHDVLTDLGEICSDPDAEQHLELLKDTHSELERGVNVVFRINSSGRPEDRVPVEVRRELLECGWQGPAYILRRSCHADGHTPVVDANCISPKELVGSYLPNGHAHEYRGHDHTLDGLGGRTGEREAGDPSIIVFGAYRLVTGHASSIENSRPIGPGTPILFSARTSEKLAMAQKAFVNSSVRESARNAIGLTEGGEEE